MAAGLYPSIREAAIASTAFKLLLFPAYKSTDFEVHRNWLAITHSLPPWEWYYERTSEWTLDYPPFFAVFEWALSHIARFFDPAMLKIENLNYDSTATVYFQRLSVIVTELVFVAALAKMVDWASNPAEKKARHAVALSLLLSPGLLIIDHIHFQYNGFMYGILMWSLLLAGRKGGRWGKDGGKAVLVSGILFAVLLCFKHIYLYLAPAYFVFLLRTYCLDEKNIFTIRWANCIRLGAGVLGIFGIALGPFAAWGQLMQLKERLFPFSRGLCHAYWAPNVWAMYSFVDRVMIYVAPRLGLSVDQSALNSVTRGLIGDTAFAVLPEVTPAMTFMLTLFFQILCLIKLWIRPTYEQFLGAVTLCGYASFLFGWHVHEKAILLVIFPFSLLALKDRRYFSAFRPLAVAGHVSLFPLLFTTPEFPIKTAYTITWLFIFLTIFDKTAPSSPSGRQFLLDRPATLFIVVSIPLIVYTSLLHGLVFGNRLEFLPLMFTSSYCAIGVVGSWVGFSWLYFTA
ncbi:dolichyl pyrophosphate Glc1Man9GlcNAc2 alpha-1,3-glucosyltransferase [Ascodesmis nigricans]|uniref:Alpha-1,3-glucosyltransferase n=1 Tax=Ascodesmis nigricans TaxID=341454 RepID=A0A4S2N5X0_9PEZI|nr:dolichyl pyrophosphate Glc1Man9GlcNAc2 alpha-1,3-glucosyltransferase [Ascodesmis nigricans]